jgi:hypothetical protein
MARLDVATFEEVEADDSSTFEAAAVLVVAAVIGSVGAAFVDGGFTGFLAWVIATIGGWYVWGWASAEVAERLFNVQTTDTGEMLRVIGYGSAPRAIGLIPWLGFVALLWTLIALVFGIRQAGEMTLAQSAITGIAGFLPTFFAYITISALL